MTRRHIAWLIGIFVIGLVLATRNAPLRNAAPPGFELLPSTLPGQPSQIAGAVALPEPKPPAPKIWFSTALEIDRMCHVGNYDCDPGIYLGSETCALPLHPQPPLVVRTFRGLRLQAQPPDLPAWPFAPAEGVGIRAEGQK